MILLSSPALNLLPSNPLARPLILFPPRLPIKFRPSCFSPTAGRPHRLHAASSVDARVCLCSQDSSEGVQQAGPAMVSSAAALAAAIRAASASPVDFVQRIEHKGGKSGLLLPSPDFQRLCLQQLDLFCAIVDPHAILSVYVRPAGSYLMDRLELRRVALHPSSSPSEMEEIVVLIGNFCIPTGLRAAETTLSSQQAQFFPECKAAIFPMVKHPFVVGFLVAELPNMKTETYSNFADNDEEDAPASSITDKSYNFPSYSDRKVWEIQAIDEYAANKCSYFAVEQETRAIKISLSLAMAYVMDQKAALLQQSSWQNNVRMSNLVEQIRGPLSSIRTLSKMLSTQVKRSEISYDIIEDILVHGDHIRDTLQQLQDAVYLTKANIVRYNDEILKKMNGTTFGDSGSALSNHCSTKAQDKSRQEVIPVIPESDSGKKDLELPMPPLALTALLHNEIRPCNVSLILEDLAVAAQSLAEKQQRSVQLCESSRELEVAVEESSLRQALSNLIEGSLLRTRVGGNVEIVSSSAPAGGALIVIDDDGPDMHYMTQMHSLTPFGADLSSDGMVEDNMTWNFIAGLTVAREILESYGCVVRVISPRTPEAALGAGGTRVEVWLPQMPTEHLL